MHHAFTMCLQKKLDTKNYNNSEELLSMVLAFSTVT